MSIKLHSCRTSSTHSFTPQKPFLAVSALHLYRYFSPLALTTTNLRNNGHTTQAVKFSQVVEINRKTGLLDSETGDFTKNRLAQSSTDRVSWSKVIRLEQPAVVTLNCSSSGNWNNRINGCNMTGTAGWKVRSLIDDRYCSSNNSWSVQVSNASFHTNTTCIRHIGPGTHKLSCVGESEGDGGLCSTKRTTNLKHKFHQYGYTIFAR